MSKDSDKHIPKSRSSTYFQMINSGNTVGSSTSGSTQRSSTMGRPRIWTEEKLVELGNKLIDWLIADDNNIHFYKFLHQYDLWEDMIAKYSEEYEEFSRLIKQAKEIQEHRIVEKGLTGEHQQAMSIFWLKNRGRNWVDKVEHQGTFLPVNINFGLLGNTPQPDPLSIPYSEVPPNLITSGSSISQGTE